MSDMDRRRFLANGWKLGAGLIAAAGVWTSWDLLQPRLASGFGGIVRSVAADAVPEDSVVEVPAARAYLTKVDGEVIALSETCTHLGCKVPYCASSGYFECPCHGSVFNRAGDFLAGPAPRGLDRYPTTIVEGVVEIDTGDKADGGPPGTMTVDEPAKGPSCEGGHGG